MEFLIVLAIVSIGVAAGFLSGMLGIGGGMLMVPFLIFLLDTPFTEARAASLFAIMLNTPLGIYKHYRFGNVRWKAGIIIGGFGIIGIVAAAFLDSFLAKHYSLDYESILRISFSILLAYTAARMLVKFEPKPHRERFYFFPLVGFFAGFLARFLGIGGGGIIVPSLAFMGVPIHSAIGTSLVAVFMNGTFSTISNLTVGHDWLILGISLGTGALAAAPFGASMARKMDAKLLRRVFGIFLLLIAIRMAISAIWG